MSQHILKRMPPDEAYWCTPERLQQLAIRELYQLELTLAASPAALDSTIPSALNHRQPLRGFRRWFPFSQKSPVITSNPHIRSHTTIKSLIGRHNVSTLFQLFT